MKKETNRKIDYLFLWFDLFCIEEDAPLTEEEREILRQARYVISNLETENRQTETGR